MNSTDNVEFRIVGSLNIPRSSHSATLLSNGKVLIAGGISPSNTSIAELYDPILEKFITTGSLISERAGHTATLLPNGKVLIVGGTSSAFSIEAELFDPISGQFSPAGAMHDHHGGHTATLLTNDKVLIAGGLSLDLLGNAHPAKNEIYDPVSDTFSITGDVNVMRKNSTAILLSNGQVLIVGGSDDIYGFNQLDSAELYDPNTGLFSSTGSLITKRTQHRATALLDGRVLVLGGYNFDNSGLYQYVTGVEIFEPSRGIFVSAGVMTPPLAGPTADLMPNGKVLIIGGTGPNASPHFSYLYNPTNGAMSQSLWIHFPRWNHATTLLLNGHVLATGGDTINGYTSSAELY